MKLTVSDAWTSEIVVRPHLTVTLFFIKEITLMAQFTLTKEELDSLQEAVVYYDCGCIHSAALKFLAMEPGDTLEVVESDSE
jgi:hypothetical protein